MVITRARQLAFTIMTLLAFVMMLLAAQTHGADMAMVEPDHRASEMQHHDGHSPAKAQCTERGSCHESKDLCDFVCSGLSQTILPAADPVIALAPVARIAPIPVSEALDGISPALDQRPPIFFFA